MNHFDASILHWFAHYAATRPALTRAMFELNGCVLLKGDLFMAALLWCWFSSRPGQRERREIVATTLIAALFSIVVGRYLATHLPFRERPLMVPELGMPQIVAEMGGQTRTWSSFPSDHAMMFAALASGLLFISVPLGLALFGYTVLIVGIPRVYLGLHHPTDVLAGMAIGTAIGAALNARAIRARLAGKVMAWHELHPASFHAAVFLALAEIGTMFSDVRSVIAQAALWAGLGK